MHNKEGFQRERGCRDLPPFTPHELGDVDNDPMKSSLAWEYYMIKYLNCLRHIVWVDIEGTEEDHVNTHLLAFLMFLSHYLPISFQHTLRAPFLSHFPSSFSPQGE